LICQAQRGFLLFLTVDLGYRNCPIFSIVSSLSYSSQTKAAEGVSPDWLARSLGRSTIVCRCSTPSVQPNILTYFYFIWFLQHFGMYFALFAS
jgi:hypothetical protein